MNIKTYIPSVHLQPYIDKLIIIESRHELYNNVLPGSSLVMSFRYKGNVSYIEKDRKSTLPQAVISGMRKNNRIIHYAENSGNFLVLFKEGGAQPFFNEPLFEFYRNTISLNELTNHINVCFVNEQLAEATNNIERIKVVEEFLLRRLSHQKPDLLISKAVDEIYKNKGNIRIKDLANKLHISIDPFEKRFRRTIGTSPKQFSFIIRMKSVLHSDLKQHSLSDLAFNAGYFDQSHFNKDFKLFTGQTPTEFLKSPVFW